MKASARLLALSCTFSLCLVLPGARPAPAAEFFVPDDPGCGTIQACIEQAADGDTVTVMPGTYPERIDFLGRAITVRGLDGPASTVIDGTHSGTVVTFASGEGNGSVLEGLTVTRAGPRDGASGPIYGVYCEDASPVIRGNTITNSLGEEGGFLAGVYVDGGAPRIEGNRIVENVLGVFASGTGFGIALFQDEGSEAAVISRNQIVGNGAGCQHPMGFCVGAGIYGEGESFIVRNNVIVGNGGLGGYGAGFGATLGGRHVEFSHNTVSESVGTGVQIEVGVSGSVLNNIVAFHTGHLYSSGLCVSGSGAVARDYNDFWANEDDTCGDEPGPHDMARDPLFVNPTTDPRQADFRLQQTSPCIDRGTDAGVGEDIEGTPRPQGLGYDMGAYEQAVAPWAPASVLGEAGQAGASRAGSLPVNLLAAFLPPAAVSFVLRGRRRRR